MCLTLVSFSISVHDAIRYRERKKGPNGTHTVNAHLEALYDKVWELKSSVYRNCIYLLNKFTGCTSKKQLKSYLDQKIKDFAGFMASIRRKFVTNEIFTCSLLDFTLAKWIEFPFEWKTGDDENRKIYVGAFSIAGWSSFFNHFNSITIYHRFLPLTA